MTAAAIPYLLAATTAVSAYSAVQTGKAQSKAAEAQARQAENDATTQLVERKRALIQTLAQQNVGAAAQGRTISSISALQSEDIRRSGYDETLIKGGAAAEAGALRSAGQAAKTAGYMKAGSSLLGGATQYAKLQ
mgnify:CR=1 FL=1